VLAYAQKNQPKVTEAKPQNMFGVPEAALSLGSSMLGRFGGLVAGGIGAMVPGPQGQAESWLKGTQDAMTYEPRSDAGKTIMGGVGDAAKWVAATRPVKAIGNAVDAVGESSKFGAGVAAGLKSLPDLVGLLGARTPLNAAESALKKAAIPSIDPQVALLGKKALDAGIPIRPDMLSESKALRGMGSFFEDVPGAGSQKMARELAVTKNVVKSINPEETAGKLTSDVYQRALNRSGSGISEIAARNPLLDAGLVDAGLKSIVTSAADYGADVKRLVGARARDFRKLINDGVVDGSAFKKWNSQMLQDIRSAGDSNAATQLSKLQNSAMDAFESSMDVGDLPAWKAYRREYATAKQLMPTVAESPTIGVVTPQSLAKSFGTKAAKDRMAAGTAGDTGDLYDLTRQFMREPVLNNLAERKLAYAGLGAAGAGIGVATGPALPAAIGGGLYGLANLYNRAGPTLARAMIEKNLPKSMPTVPTSPIGSGPMGGGLLPIGQATEIPMPAGMFGDLKKSSGLENFTVGQGAVTNEAARRFASDQAAGRYRYIGNRDASNIRQLKNPTEVDLKPGRGQTTAQWDGTKYIELERGEGVTDSMVARLLAKLNEQEK
jgi:hypothetical protein